MIRKSLPWIVFFGTLLLLVFSNSSYVKIFDPVMWPVRFRVLAGFLCSSGPGGDFATTRQAAMRHPQTRRIVSSLPRCAGSTAIRNAQGDSTAHSGSGRHIPAG